MCFMMRGQYKEEKKVPVREERERFLYQGEQFSAITKNGVCVCVCVCVCVYIYRESVLVLGV